MPPKSSTRIVLGKIFLVLIAAVVLFLSVNNTASAQSRDSGVVGRVWVGSAGRYVLHDNEPFSDPTFGTVGLHVQGSAPAVGGDVEYRLNRWFGVDGAAVSTRFNIRFDSSNAPARHFRKN